MNRIHANISRRSLEARSFRRYQVEKLRGRLDLLDGKEKAMMVMHVENGSSFRQIATLLGVCETSVARRIRRISQRLLDGEYIACLRNRDKLTKVQMVVAKDYFLKGLSKRKIAQNKNWSRYRVARIVDDVRSILARTALQSDDVRISNRGKCEKGWE